MSNELPVAQQTAWQQASTIDCSHTALIVVDVTGGTDEGGPELAAMSEQCVTLVQAARAANVPVLFTCDAHLPGVDHELELWGDHCLAGTPASLPLAAFDFKPGPREFLIPKRRYDSFYQTSLELTLRELGATTLIVCGCDTNICVLQTLAGAYYRGFNTVLAADACATFLIGTQQAGLEYASRCFDARVVTTSDVLGYLAK
jgi:nicotinamidase-related amidase